MLFTALPPAPPTPTTDMTGTAEDMGATGREVGRCGWACIIRSNEGCRSDLRQIPTEDEPRKKVGTSMGCELTIRQRVVGRPAIARQEEEEEEDTLPSI